MITRRQSTILMFGAAFSAAFGKKISSANPLLLFILRFFFGRAVQTGIRASSRMFIGRGVARLTIGGSGKIIRVGRASAMGMALAPEKAWTQEFVERGLEELLWQAVDIEPVLDEEVKIPDNSAVYRQSDEEENSVEIGITNPTQDVQFVTVTCYLYDIDAGVVDFKYQDMFVGGIPPNDTVYTELILLPLPHTGRKVLVVEQRNFDTRVSDVFFVV